MLYNAICQLYLNKTKQVLKKQQEQELKRWKGRAESIVQRVS